MLSPGQLRAAIARGIQQEAEINGPIEPDEVLPSEQPCPTCDDEGWDGGCCECPDCGLL